MNRPSISLCLIAKNEINNLDILLSSVESCFDVIHITDTGSTDGTLELLRKYEAESPDNNPSLTPIKVHQFEWCDDFAKARNYSFSFADTDYVAWLDLDDSLSDRFAFRKWRDNVMKYADFWIATYHYSLNEKGVPVCSFSRERVVKRNLGFTWNYFIHEGIPPISSIPDTQVRCEFAMTWAVNHRRTKQDLEKDRSRNISIIEKRINDLDPRMKYYYGKELFENNNIEKALSVLVDAVAEEKLENHDRIMGIQYACFSAMMLNKFELAIQLAHNGLQLEPERAEFFNIIADSYTKQNKHANAIPYYSAAARCKMKHSTEQHIFQMEESYKHYPLNRLAQLYFLLGDLDKAETSVNEALKFGDHHESLGIKKELTVVKTKVKPDIATIKNTDDITILCHDRGFYEWDEDVYREKGIGGSETAAVEMARWMSAISGRKVLIFNNREDKKTFGNVSYLPHKDAAVYFSKYKPYVNINWRHSLKATEAPTFIWNHDLGFLGLQQKELYNKIFCLSNFHKEFVRNFYNVSYDKIHVTENGINPDRFNDLKFEKEKGKVVFSSSPDRGVKEAIEIMDKVIEKIPFATLHVYYGIDNLYKAGRGKEADELKALMQSRHYVHFHGNVSQKELTNELSTAQAWLYPTNFLETYCITAIEMLACKVYPIVRGAWGAVEETILSCAGQKSAIVYDHSDTDKYASHVINAIESELWREITFDPKTKSWENVASSWLKYFEHAISI